MTGERLQKLIASSGLCSRRHAENLILEKRIKVNNITAKIGDKADPNVDRIFLDDVPLFTKISMKVFLINKPSGFVSSCKDQFGRPTILELLPKNSRKGLYPVGRLDMNSRGAILLTNNGELTLKLTHPRYQHTKIYLVWLRGNLSNDKLNQWRKGVLLDEKLTLPSKIKFIWSDSNQTLLEICLREGRNRQIRRIAELLGHPVIDLLRTEIGGISLKGMPEGTWRKLDKTEWQPILDLNMNH